MFFCRVLPIVQSRQEQFAKASILKSEILRIKGENDQVENALLLALEQYPTAVEIHLKYLESLLSNDKLQR